MGLEVEVGWLVGEWGFCDGVSILERTERCFGFAGV